MKILITGSNGFLAQNIIRHLSDYDLTLVNREVMNLADGESVNHFFSDKEFDIVIHTAIKGGRRLVQDDAYTLYENISMISNLIKNKDKFGKLIHFGSGAELDRSRPIDGKNENIFDFIPSDYYGLSKNIIARLCLPYDNFYNLRIFNVFNEHERSDRMIKNNISRYINNETIIINQNRLMDFFHMDDLIKVIKYYIENDNCPNIINCSYESKYSLLQIANIINSLDNHKVKIKIENQETGFSYFGKYSLNKIPIELNTLENSIIKTYNFIKQSFYNI